MPELLSQHQYIPFLTEHLPHSDLSGILSCRDPSLFSLQIHSGFIWTPALFADPSRGNDLFPGLAFQESGEDGRSPGQFMTHPYRHSLMVMAATPLFVVGLMVMIMMPVEIPVIMIMVITAAMLPASILITVLIMVMAASGMGVIMIVSVFVIMVVIMVMMMVVFIPIIMIVVMTAAVMMPVIHVLIVMIMAVTAAAVLLVTAVAIHMDMSVLTLAFSGISHIHNLNGKVQIHACQGMVAVHHHLVPIHCLDSHRDLAFLSLGDEGVPHMDLVAGKHGHRQLTHQGVPVFTVAVSRTDINLEPVSFLMAGDGPLQPRHQIFGAVHVGQKFLLIRFVKDLTVISGEGVSDRYHTVLIYLHSQSLSYFQASQGQDHLVQHQMSSKFIRIFMQVPPTASPPAAAPEANL